jgi:hypothetical protein
MNSETELPSRVAEEDARLEALLVEGLAGGENIPLTREFWNELAAEAGQIGGKPALGQEPSIELASSAESILMSRSPRELSRNASGSGSERQSIPS